MDAFLGSILMWPMNWAPVGWMLCQGQLLPIVANQALFSLIGTTYGGDGKATFALPNLQGVFPMGAGPANVLGSKGGAASVTLTATQMPIHIHPTTLVPSTTATATGTVNVTVQGSTAPGGTNTPNGNYLAGAVQGSAHNAGGLFVTNPGAATLGPIAGVTATVSGLTAPVPTVQVGPAGGATPISIEPPYLVMNFIICTQGMFPPRQ